MSARRHVCPVCGGSYRPEYADKADAPEGTIGREQHLSGVCSDECWDGLVPLPEEL